MMSLEGFVKKIISGLYWYFKRKRFSGKISNIFSGVGSGLTPVPQEIAAKYRKLWSPFSSAPDTRWLKVYAGLSGLVSHEYIPEDIYYTEIEPRLNNRSLSASYTDKNLYDRIFETDSLPQTYLRGINGHLFNNKYEQVTHDEAKKILTSCRQFILKPSVGSGGGRMVRLFRSEGGRFSETVNEEIFSFDEVMKMGMQDFICQERIGGHSSYSRYNSSSLNTVRFLVYRSVKTGEVHIVNCVFRVGKSGSVVDNQASGGYACGVTPEGKLNGKVVNKEGLLFKSVNDVAVEPGTELPGFEKMKDLAMKMGSQVHYAHLSGLDLCLDDRGTPRIIEINCLNNEINFFQMTNGPLLGDFTDEIVSWCADRKRHFMIDYDI
jgi:hypothetical protein